MWSVSKETAKFEMSFGENIRSGHAHPSYEKPERWARFKKKAVGWIDRHWDTEERCFLIDQDKFKF